MKDFIVVLSKYVRPYKTYLFGSLFFNLLSAVLNVFSLLSLIPMLQLLFGIDKQSLRQNKNSTTNNEKFSFQFYCLNEW